jgi:hypothetical protein
MKKTNTNTRLKRKMKAENTIKRSVDFNTLYCYDMNYYPRTEDVRTGIYLKLKSNVILLGKSRHYTNFHSLI